MRRTSPIATRRRITAVTILASLLFFASAGIADTETWDFDLTTDGGDVFWTSPTAVCNIADEYDTFYEITLVEVGVSYMGIPLGPFDVTDELSPEDLTGSDTLAGPPPVTVYDGWVGYPEPPEQPSIEAHVFMELDADGYGQISVTDVYLGTMDYDLGPPWGVVTVQIESLRIVGYLEITPRLFGDLDGDGDVDLDDLAALLSNYGMTSGASYEDGDIDGDGDVDLADLAVLLAHYGLSC